MNRAEISLKIRFNVFDVKSPLLSTSKLRKHGYSVLLDQQQTIQKEGTMIVLTDQNGLPTRADREKSMSGCVRRLKRSVRKRGEQLRCTCPEDSRTQSDERTEQSDDGIPVVHVDNAFLHYTGDQDAKVTHFTMVDNSSGSMVATAVQKKGHDKFVERFLLNCLESSGLTGEMVLQTDKETGPMDVTKHVAAERKATTLIRQTPKKGSQSNSYVERAHQGVEANHERGDRRQCKNQTERDGRHHDLDDSRRTFPANTFLSWKGP